MSGLIDKALKVAKLEKVRRLQQLAWQRDPMLWLKERFGEEPSNFEWTLFKEYQDHKWDGDINPLLAAWQAIANQESAAVEAGTGTSKTFCLSRIVFWFLDVFPDSLIVTSAPKQAQLTLNLWAEITKAFYKFKRIRPKSALYNLRLVVEEKDEKEDFDFDNPDTSKSWHAIGFVAGVGSEEQSATKAQGFHRKDMLLILEETPGMPDAVLTAFRNTCTGENNIILAVGNPDSELDPLHTFSQLPDVKHIRVSAYDYPNVVMKKEHFPGAVTIKSIKKRADEYGVKSPIYQSRVRGISPAQSTDSLLHLDWLKAALVSKLKYDGGFHAVGVDVANSSDGDKACLAWGTGPILRKVQDFYCKNANHLAYNLVMDAETLAENGYEDYNTDKLSDFDVMDGFVGVDPVGVGTGTVNTLLDLGYNPVSLAGREWEEVIPSEFVVLENGKEINKPMYKFQNLRSQMFWELREDFRKGFIRFDESFNDDKDLLRDLFRELVSIRVAYKDNFIAVEKKEEIKKRLNGKSPNKADAVAYWNWVRKGYRVLTGGMPIG